jgi:hypothetical protein
MRGIGPTLCLIVVLVIGMIAGPAFDRFVWRTLK